MATKEQLKKIHVLKHNLFMSDDDYRAAMEGFTASNGKPVRSSSEMSIMQASAFIDALERVEDRIPSLRQNRYASPKQTRFIAALWRNVSRAKDPVGRTKTLESFLSRRFHVRRSGFIPRSVAPRVIKTLRIMNERLRDKDFSKSSKESDRDKVYMP